MKGAKFVGLVLLAAGTIIALHVAEARFPEAIRVACEGFSPRCPAAVFVSVPAVTAGMQNVKR